MKKGEFKNSIQFGSSKLLSKITTSSNNLNIGNISDKNLPIKQDFIKKFTNFNESKYQKSSYMSQKFEIQNKEPNSQKFYKKSMLNDITSNKNIPQIKLNSHQNMNINLSINYKDRYSNENASQNKFKSGYMTKKNLDDNKLIDSKYGHRNSFDRVSETIKSLSKNHISKHIRRSSQQLQTQYKSTLSKENIEKLNEKLYSLENRINTMKNQMQKKRQIKKNMLQKDFNERKLRDIQRMEKAKDLQENNKPLESFNQQKKKENHQIKNQNIQLKQSRLLQQVVTKVPKYNKELYYFTKDPYSPKHNIYYVSEVIRAYNQINSLTRQHLINSMKTLRNMKYSTKIPLYEEKSKKKLILPKNECYKQKKTVIFDLDQTLVHCNDSLQTPCDVKIKITFPNSQVIQAGINIRPYACQIIKNLAKNFQIIIFTASHSCYANPVIDYLDPQKKYVQHRLFRQDCYITQDGIYVKDLRVIPRNLKDIVLVDNAAYSYYFQLENGIPIIPYYQGKNDYELKALQHYIQKLNLIHDVRIMNNKTFKLNSYADYDNEEMLVKSLYLSQ